MCEVNHFDLHLFLCCSHYDSPSKETRNKRRKKRYTRGGSNPRPTSQEKKKKGSIMRIFKFAIVEEQDRGTYERVRRVVLKPIEQFVPVIFIKPRFSLPLRTSLLPLFAFSLSTYNFGIKQQPQWNEVVWRKSPQSSGTVRSFMPSLHLRSPLPPLSFALSRLTSPLPLPSPLSLSPLLYIQFVSEERYHDRTELGIREEVLDAFLYGALVQVLSEVLVVFLQSLAILKNLPIH